MADQETQEQVEKDEAEILAMLGNFAGLTDRDAFSQLFTDVREIMQMIHRQRGHVTDEDLLERTQWAIERAVGYKAPVELSINDV